MEGRVQRPGRGLGCAAGVVCDYPHPPDQQGRGHLQAALSRPVFFVLGVPTCTCPAHLQQGPRGCA